MSRRRGGVDERGRGAAQDPRGAGHQSQTTHRRPQGQGPAAGRAARREDGHLLRTRSCPAFLSRSFCPSCGTLADDEDVVDAVDCGRWSCWPTTRTATCRGTCSARTTRRPSTATCSSRASTRRRPNRPSSRFVVVPAHLAAQTETTLGLLCFLGLPRFTGFYLVSWVDWRRGWPRFYRVWQPSFVFQVEDGGLVANRNSLPLSD